MATVKDECAAFWNNGCFVHSVRFYYILANDNISRPGSVSPLNPSKMRPFPNRVDSLVCRRGLHDRSNAMQPGPFLWRSTKAGASVSKHDHSPV